MANVFCAAGKKALLDATLGHRWKAALYTADAKLNTISVAYATAGEVPNGNGYAAGGVSLTGASTGSAFGVAWLDFDDPSWPQATFTCRYMLIYDASDSNRSYGVIEFTDDNGKPQNKTGQGGNFVAEMPPSDAIHALVRI
jgi:hypothetical protein